MKFVCKILGHSPFSLGRKTCCKRCWRDLKMENHKWVLDDKPSGWEVR